MALVVVLSMGTAVAFTSPGDVAAMDGDHDENETTTTPTPTPTADDHDNETKNETTTDDVEDEDNVTNVTGNETNVTAFGESFRVTSVQVTSSVESGEPVVVAATITNPNDVTTAQFVELRLGGVLVQFGELTLEPGESMTLRFSVPTEGLQDGIYVVSVLAQADGQTSLVSVGAVEPEDNVTNVTEPVDNVTNVTDNVTNVTEPEDNVTNVTEPEDNVTNVTEPEDNVTNVTEPEDNVTNITEPEENVTNVTDNVTNVTEPEDNVTDENVTNESFAVVGFSAPDTAEVGETVNVTATVVNPNDEEVTQEVQFRVFGNLVDSREITLGPDETENVTFTLETEGLPAGEYIHSVLTEQFGAVAILELTSPADGNVTDGNVTDGDNVTDVEDNVTVDNVTEDNVTDANVTNVTADNVTADNETVASVPDG